jgi:hypothetical protein
MKTRANHAGRIPGPRGGLPLVTVLCAARTTVYRAFPGIAVYTHAADAWTARVSGPVVAHPPCRCWSRASVLTRLETSLRVQEMMLGVYCAEQVLRHGGILEQPAWSKLWQYMDLPFPGQKTSDPLCWSVAVDQANWGHRISKPTWLLFSRIERAKVAWPNWLLAGETNLVQRNLTPGQRSATPLKFAQFLIDTATKCRHAKCPGPLPGVAASL